MCCWGDYWGFRQESERGRVLTEMEGQFLSCSDERFFCLFTIQLKLFCVIQFWCLSNIPQLPPPLPQFWKVFWTYFKATLKKKSHFYLESNAEIWSAWWHSPQMADATTQKLGPVFRSFSSCLHRLWTLRLGVLLHQFSRVEDMVKLKVEEFDEGEHDTNSSTIQTPYQHTWF